MIVKLYNRKRKPVGSIEIRRRITKSDREFIASLRQIHGPLRPNSMNSIHSTNPRKV